MVKDVLDAVYGSVIGGAIGDALGAPVEGWYYTEIWSNNGRVTEFVETDRGNAPDGPGGVTDDTALAHYISLSIVRTVNEPLFEEIEGDRSADFYSMARRLVEALQAERQAAQDRVDMLDRILGS